ncbi:MAG: hypothetical protein SWH61_00195 [Thermodesulfobacteriota bacterium]|nr:hypothetical protein [Thermodesulfobacteriota bacterium]
MKTSIFEVLETMFYLAPEFAEFTDHSADAMDRSNALLGCEIGFSNSFSGRFVALSPASFIREMTENFMALPPDEIQQTHMEGIIKEFLNMVAGSTFRVYNDAHVFNLGTPAILDSEKAAVVIQNAVNNPLSLAKTDNGIMWVTIDL